MFVMDSPNLYAEALSSRGNAENILLLPFLAHTQKKDHAWRKEDDHLQVRKRREPFP
jgi:hypothetical protein